MLSSCQPFFCEVALGLRRALRQDFPCKLWPKNSFLSVHFTCPASCTLKNGKQISIHLLLKSLPASSGMTRPQLFQQAEPNHGAMVTIVTFQHQDHELVLARQAALEEEIRNIIAEGEEEKIFINNIDGQRNVSWTYLNGVVVSPFLTIPPIPHTPILSFFCQPPKNGFSL